MTDIRFPNESKSYRKAREELLDAEKELRRHIEQVAAQRRALPQGGALKENYVFEELVDDKVVQTSFTDLFTDGHDALFLYNFMYSPSMDYACSGCTALMDGLDGQIRHINQNISTAVVAKHDIRTFHEHAQTRGWKDLRLLSSKNNSYHVDYYGEVDGNQITNANIFQRDGDTIRHFWNSEMVFATPMEGCHPRHLDIIWPLWGVLDMTPLGRGDFSPSLRYD